MLFQLAAPNEAGEIISQLIGKQLGLEKPIDTSFVGSVIWFSLLGLVVRYFQTVVHIERQYNYIHGLEKQLGRYYTDKAFTREGEFYLGEYPLFSKWTSFLYTIAFPILLLLLVVIKIFDEFCRGVAISPSFLFNVSFFLGIVISTALYLFMIHFRK